MTSKRSRKSKSKPKLTVVQLEIRRKEKQIEKLKAELKEIENAHEERIGKIHRRIDDIAAVIRTLRAGSA